MPRKIKEKKKQNYAITRKACAAASRSLHRMPVGRETRRRMEGAAMSAQGPSPLLFFDTVNAFQRTEALRSAIELNLFTQVAAGRRTAAQIAEACQASPRGVRILADARHRRRSRPPLPRLRRRRDRVPADARDPRLLPAADRGGAARRDRGLRG